MDVRSGGLAEYQAGARCTPSATEPFRRAALSRPDLRGSPWREPGSPCSTIDARLRCPRAGGVFGEGVAGWGVGVEDESVELTEAISALRRQLGEAMRAGEDEDIRFRLGSVELEFALTVKKDVHGDGGVRFGVISLGAGGGLSRDTVQRVKLTLQPIDAAGDDLEVRSRQVGRPR